MTLDQIKERVRRATVRLPRIGGCGVLVPGGYVLTATHCVSQTDNGDMALNAAYDLGEDVMEKVETADGGKLLLVPVAVETVNDLAVLGACDPNNAPEQAEAFFDFHNATEPILLSTDVPAEGSPVNILAHTGQWLRGSVVRSWHGREMGRVWLEVKPAIQKGTSGGAVVDDQGRLLGVVSNSGQQPDGRFEGSISLAYLSLPRWLGNRIAEAVEVEEAA